MSSARIARGLGQCAPDGQGTASASCPLPPLRPNSWNAVVTQLAFRRRDVETAKAVSCDESEAVSKMDNGMLAARPMNTSIRLKMSAADAPDIHEIYFDASGNSGKPTKWLNISIRYHVVDHGSALTSQFAGDPERSL